MEHTLRGSIQPIGKQYFYQCRVFRSASVFVVFGTEENRGAWPAADWKQTKNLSIPSQLVLHFLDKLPVFLNRQEYNSICFVFLFVKANITHVHALKMRENVTGPT